MLVDQQMLIGNLSFGINTWATWSRFCSQIQLSSTPTNDCYA